MIDIWYAINATAAVIIFILFGLGLAVEKTTGGQSIIKAYSVLMMKVFSWNWVAFMFVLVFFQ